MGRLPFNPKAMAAKSALKPATPAQSPLDEPVLLPGAVPVSQADAAAAATSITVTDLAALIDTVLRENMPAPVRVVGEIGQFRDRTHWYFDVKDQGACVSCVMFRGAAQRTGFVPQVGQKVLLTGSVEFYAKLGRMSFIVERVETIGLGALDLAFKRLCEELRGLGWFEQDRKRPLPFFPRKVAVVTSRSAAALQDVLDTVRRRCPSLRLALTDVRVQGEGAAEQIARTIRAIGLRHAELGIDVILVTRGGGSMEDLWCFNERIVAEAIVNSPIPVVAAIGHETDTTVAELVADVRCATPTQAAMRIAPDREALLEQLTSSSARLHTLVRRQIKFDAERLRGLMRHRLFADPAFLIVEGRQSLDSAQRRLAFGVRDGASAAAARLDRASARLERHRPGALYARRESRLRTAHARLEAAITAFTACFDFDVLQKRLDSAWRAGHERRACAVDAAARGLDLVGPHSVLKRGFSVTLKADGGVLRSAQDAAPGDVVRTRLADGSFSSVVSAEGGDARAIVPRVQPPRKRPPTLPKARDQMDLFLGGG